MALPTPQRLNPALWSVFLRGPDSPYANWFDVDHTGGAAILLPILGSRIDEVIDAGELSIERDAGPEGESILRYYDHEFPIRLGTEELPLEELLAAAHYRLAFWQIAGEELNYRRFFDVDTLVAIRVEDPQVFADSHEVLIRLCAEGIIDAFRIDHPDGLADPQQYLARLHAKAPDTWVVVEKIVARDEALPSDWQCAGTTGYDAIAEITPLFVQPEGAVVMRGAFAEVSSKFLNWDEVATASKHQVLETILISELDRLATLAHVACQANVRLRDYSLRGITEALRELLTQLQVYRAYVSPGLTAPPESEQRLAAAATAAQETSPHRSAEISLIRDMALGRVAVGRSDLLDEFIIRFQQTSGPVLAKGVEDTASYRWLPLISLCDVGMEPDRFGVEIAEFHQWCATRLRETPLTMNALSTHDTKRSEDVRARINVLSEMPDKWMDWIQDWQYLSGPFEPSEGFRDARTEWLLWQTMVGAWPISRQRMGDYLTKAVREAKVCTSWVSPYEDYETALSKYLDGIYDNAILMESFRLAVNELRPGFVANSLGQRALQLFIPGVPDIYQGCETVNLRLVDPDNREPVDHAELTTILDRCSPEIDPFDDLEAAKMRLTVEGLHLRKRRPAAVGEHGGYTPLTTSGEAAAHFVGFLRADKIACLVSRFTMQLDTQARSSALVELPAGIWRNVLTNSEVSSSGTAISVDEVLGSWPVAVLDRLDKHDR